MRFLVDHAVRSAIAATDAAVHIRSETRTIHDRVQSHYIQRTARLPPL